MAVTASGGHCFFTKVAGSVGRQLKFPFMPRPLFILLLPLLLLTAAPGQERLPIHMLELEAHRDVVVDYARIDSLARAMPLPLPRAVAPSKEVVGYLPWWQYGIYPDLNYDLLTQINYFSAELDSTGNIVTDHNWPTLELVEFAHARNVKVKLTATIKGSGPLTELLSNPSHRLQAIASLVARVRDAGADGVDIDFELLPKDQRANMVTFMAQLSDALEMYRQDALLTMAVPAVDWSGAWDYDALAGIVDGLFIMAYDYHWKGSATAGPVSPLSGTTLASSWNVTKTVNDYLTKTGSATDKLILGQPYYGYDWPVTGAAKYAATTGNGKAILYPSALTLAFTSGYNWDATSANPWFNYYDGGNRQVWFDDSLSLAGKYALAHEKDLAGVGMWALGHDGDRLELWGALADYLDTTLLPADTALVVLHPNYPNPFPVETTISFTLLKGGHVRLAVYDLRGVLMRPLLSKILPAGLREIPFIAVDRRGQRLASGIYFAVLVLNDKTVVAGKMLLLK